MNENFDFDELNEEEDSGFRITDDSLADWAIKKIKEEQEDTNRLIELANAEIESLSEKIKGFEDRYNHKVGYLKSKLYEYFETCKTKETKTQRSYELLSGKLVFKKPTEKMVPDKDKLLAYCKECGMTEFVKVKEELDWASYKKECEIVDGQVVNVQTGDIIDCVSVEEVPGTFDVK